MNYKSLRKALSMQTKRKISLEAVVFSIYVALTPANQIFKLTSGSTINKYIGLAVIITIGIKKLMSGEKLTFSSFKIVGLLLLWLGITTIWSVDRSITISSIISLANYVLLWLLVCEKKWTDSEKKLIMYLSIAIGLYISYTLILSQLSGDRRSTIVVEETGLHVDQNGLAVALSYLFIMALNRLFENETKIIKLLMAGSCFVFVVGIFTTGSRGALIGLIVGFLYYVKSSKGIYHKIGTASKAAIVCGVGLLIYIIISKNWIINSSTLNRYTDQELLFETGGSGRVEIWEMYIDILNQTIYPYFIGFGYGTTYSAFTMYKYSWIVATHNTFLYLLVCSGIVGMTLFLYVILQHIKKCNEHGDLLSKTLIIITLISMITLDQFTKKDVWNVLAFAQIGLGCASMENTSLLQKKDELHRYRYIK